MYVPFYLVQLAREDVDPYATNIHFINQIKKLRTSVKMIMHLLIGCVAICSSAAGEMKLILFVFNSLGMIVKPRCTRASLL